MENLMELSCHAREFGFLPKENDKWLKDFKQREGSCLIIPLKCGLLRSKDLISLSAKGRIPGLTRQMKSLCPINKWICIFKDLKKK
jgi:hypothetical protein